MRSIIVMMMGAMLLSACASTTGHIQASQWDNMDYAEGGYSMAENLAISPGMGMR
jgi:uncharacterized protein YceK